MTSLEDYQFLQSLKGKRIKLNLKEDTFIGVVQRILNKIVTLEDVKAVKSGRKHPVRHFHGREILGVEFLRSTEHTTGNNVEATIGKGYLTVAKHQPYKRTILQDKEDDEFLNYVVIDELNQNYLPAIMEIQKQKVIGVGVDGIGGVYLERLCWLQIATKNKVFLFDILALGTLSFKNGLTKILASNRILKVAHDCRRLAACLTIYRVKLMNVFDTQVADFLHFYRQTGGLLSDRVSTMEEVVSLHLDIPATQLSSLNIKHGFPKEDREVWYRRPCPQPLLKLMALSVIHLLPLRQVLLNALMSDYTSLVDSYMASVLYEPVHTQDIGQNSGLELSQELCQLENQQRERQAWAKEYYPSTLERRLVRSMPRSNSSTSAGATSTSSSHSHASHNSDPSSAPPTDRPDGPMPPSDSPVLTNTPYTTPPTHTPTPQAHKPTALTPTPPEPDSIEIPTPPPSPEVALTLTALTPAPPWPDSIEIPTPPPSPEVTFPTPQAGKTPVVNSTLEVVPSCSSSQSQGNESPALTPTILSMKPRVLSMASPKVEALPKKCPKTFFPESAASFSHPAGLLEVVTDTMGQSMPPATKSTGQASIGSYFSLGRGLHLQRAAVSNQGQHTNAMPQSPTGKVAGSEGSVSSASGARFSLRPMAAMAGVAQQIGSSNHSAGPPLCRGTVLPSGPLRPSSLSLSFRSFRTES